MFDGDDEKLSEKIRSNSKEDVIPDQPESITENNNAHVIASLQGLSYARGVKRPTDEEAFARRVKLPRNPENKPLAIFDMDETLIHCLPTVSETGSSAQENETDVVLRIPDYSR